MAISKATSLVANRPNKKIDLVLALVFALSFFVIGLQQVDRAVDLGWHDTGWYLKNAIQIHETGGLRGFFSHCFNGTYREANQHPLYLVLLSFFASRNLTFFTKAKLVSFSIGLLTLIMTYFLVLSLYGRAVAILSTLLLEFNSYFLRESSHVAAEILLVLASLLAWYFIIKGFEKNKFWIAAGLFAGLAYLSKGSGIFFLFIFVLSAFFIQGFSVLRNKYFYYFFLAFGLISLPLLWRNALVYHNPIFNINSHVMWLDNWKQTYDPAYSKHPPNLIIYFKTHSLDQAFGRMVIGSKKELFLLFDSLKLTGYLQQFYVGLLFGVLAIFGFFLDLDKRRRLVNLLFLASFFMFFSWYNPIVADARFILPLIPILFILASVALVKIVKKIACIVGINSFWQNKNVKIWAYVFTILIIWVVPTVHLLSQGLGNPFHSYRTAPGYTELLQWLEKNITARDKYILWPAHNYWFEWYAPIRGESIPFPEVKDFSLLRKFIAFKGITYIIIHPEMIQERKNILKTYFQVDSVGGVHQLRPVAHWTKIWQPPIKPVPFLIFKVTD